MRVMRGFSGKSNVPFRDGFHVSFSMFVDRKNVMDRVDAKNLKVLSRTGAYVMRAMRNSIKPAPKKEQRKSVVVVRGINCKVPVFGKVIDANTGAPVSHKVSIEARKKVATFNKSLGAGQPPRRGPTDLLRKRIFYGVETETETVVIGPEKFTKQPELIGAASVPELLDKGGKEVFHFARQRFIASYEPRPFVGPLVPLAEKTLERFIEDIPL